MTPPTRSEILAEAARLYKTIIERHARGVAVRSEAARLRRLAETLVQQEESVARPGGAEGEQVASVAVGRLESLKIPDPSSLEDILFTDNLDTVVPDIIPSSKSRVQERATIPKVEFRRDVPPDPAESQPAILATLAEDRTRTCIRRLLCEGLGVGTGQDPWHHPWPFDPQRVHTYLLDVSGSEIEGQEISLAFLLINLKESCKVKDLAQDNDDVSLTFLHTPDDFRVFFGHLDLAKAENWRETLVENSATFPGDLFRPLLVLARKRTNKPADTSLCDCTVAIPRSTKLSTSDAHGLYSELTKQLVNSQAAVIWMKPARAVRIYRDGALKGHILRLRKSQNTACRDPDDFDHALMDQLEKRGLSRGFEDSHRRRILQAAVELSEKRSGGAIYIMDRDEVEGELAKAPSERQLIDRCQPLSSSEQSPLKLTSLPNTALLMFLQKDGATIVSNGGEILAIGAYLKGSGGRRGTAKSLCCRTADHPNGPLPRRLAIVISQDGDVLITGEHGFINWGVHA